MKLDEKYQLDNIDYQILTLLQRDARSPFLEIARKLEVSGGTIHQRVNRLTELGIIEGSTIKVNKKKLGLGVSVLLGIHLTNAKHINKVLTILDSLKEVSEAYYTTGTFGLVIKVDTKDIEEFHQFLTKKIQYIEEVQSTESFICLDNPINKPINFGALTSTLAI